MEWLDGSIGYEKLVNKLTGRVIEALGQGAIADLGTH
jgi:hypothetical protein